MTRPPIRESLRRFRRRISFLVPNHRISRERHTGFGPLPQTFELSSGVPIRFLKSSHSSARQSQGSVVQDLVEAVVAHGVAQGVPWTHEDAGTGGLGGSVEFQAFPMLHLHGTRTETIA